MCRLSFTRGHNFMTPARDQTIVRPLDPQSSMLNGKGANPALTENTWSNLKVNYIPILSPRMSIHTFIVNNEHCNHELIIKEIWWCRKVWDDQNIFWVKKYRRLMHKCFWNMDSSWKVKDLISSAHLPFWSAPFMFKMQKPWPNSQ